MSNTKSAEGQCLCGAVSMRADVAASEVGACHCKMCRTWSGGPFLGADCQSSVRITGKDNVTVFSSSEWAERGFCNRCGTHLFYRLKQNDQYIVAAGFFDNDADFAMDHQVFIDEKPAYYAFAGKTKNFTGEEVFKMFGGESGQ